MRAREPVGEGLAGVLLDMDGTLLDSEKVWDVALAGTARWLGGALSAGARESMVGSSLGRSVAILHDDLGVGGDERATGRHLTELAAGLFRDGLVWKPGAAQLLQALYDAHVPAALVTSTQRALTEIALDTIGRQYFAASVCGGETERPKPFPDPYLRAAELLDVDPSRCVAVEDSPLGIEAAEAAGCVVLAVPSEVPIAPAPTRTVRDSLVGLTVSDLEALR